MEAPRRHAALIFQHGRANEVAALQLVAKDRSSFSKSRVSPFNVSSAVISPARHDTSALSPNTIIIDDRSYIASVASLQARKKAPEAFLKQLFAHPFSATTNVLRRLFVPSGAVSPEYAQFQLADSIQGSCSYLRGILAMTATLEGVGIGSGREGGPSASIVAAVLTFILKDGSGMLGSLLFSYWAANLFDSEVKLFRLFADVINDVGMTLELLAPAVSVFVSGCWDGIDPYRVFLVTTCGANIAKSLCGVSAGATRVAIASHFAKEGQVAEVQAKESAQETAITLLGLVLGVFLTSWLNSSNTIKWCAFVFLTFIHVVANYYAVRILRLNSLTPTRVAILTEDFTSAPQSSSWVAVSPELMPRVEPVLPVQYQLHFPALCGRSGRGAASKSLLALKRLRTSAQQSWWQWWNVGIDAPACIRQVGLAELLQSVQHVRPHHRTDLLVLQVNNSGAISLTSLSDVFQAASMTDSFALVTINSHVSFREWNCVYNVCGDTQELHLAVYFLTYLLAFSAHDEVALAAAYASFDVKWQAFARGIRKGEWENSSVGSKDVSLQTCDRAAIRYARTAAATTAAPAASRTGAALDASGVLGTDGDHEIAGRRSAPRKRNRAHSHAR
jgi:hypothetical protein